MKKYLSLLVAALFIVSIVFAGIGCQAEAEETTAAETTAAAEETTAAAEETTAAEEETTAEEKSYVINWWTWNNPSYEWELILQEEFSKIHPNVTFETHVQDQYKIRDTWGPAARAEDETLDCGKFYYGAVLKPIAEAGLALDLTPYFEKYGWYDIMYKGADLYQINGTPYLLNGTVISTPYIWYNTEMFADAGVEPADSMDGLLEICNTLQAAGYDTIVAGFQTQWPLQHLFNLMCANIIGAEDYDELIHTTDVDYNGAMKWTDPRIGDAMLQIKWLYDNGILSERCFAIDWPGSRGAIQGLEASMISDGSWEAGWLDAETEGRLTSDYFMWPDPTPDELPYKLTASAADGYAIAAHLEQDKADMCAEFFDFMMTKDNQLMRLEYGMDLMRGDLTEEELSGMDSKMLSIKQDVDTYGFVQISDIWLTTEFIERMTTTVQEVVLGTTDVESALQSLEDLAADIRTR